MHKFAGGEAGRGAAGRGAAADGRGSAGRGAAAAAGLPAAADGEAVAVANGAERQVQLLLKVLGRRLSSLIRSLRQRLRKGHLMTKK